MNDTQKDLIYMLSCAVNGITPDNTRVQGIEDKQFDQAYKKAVRKNIKVKGDTLDWNYIMEQCNRLEIEDFEQERRQLAVKVFSSDTLPDLTNDETEMLMDYLTAGTYGTYEKSVKKKLKNRSKRRFGCTVYSFHASK